MGPLINRKIFYTIGVILAPIYLSFLWACYYNFLIISFILFTMAFVFFMLKTKKPLMNAYNIFFSYMLFLHLIFFCYKKPVTVSHFDQNTILKINYIQESKTQLRITLKDDKNNIVLGIYYKPKKIYSRNDNVFNKVTGVIEKITYTKKQVHLIIDANDSKVLLIIAKKNLTSALETLKIGTKISSQAKKNKFFTPLNHQSKKYTKYLKTGVKYIYYAQNISLDYTGKLGLFFVPTHIDIKNFNVGDFITITPNTSLQVVKALKNPKYLFAQNISYYGTIKTIKKANQLPSLSISEKVTQSLIQLYKTTSYPSFYWSVLLSKKPLDKEIYNLFRKNELVHLLVISGGHINIVISFFMALLSILFIVPFIMKNSLKKSLKYVKGLRFFDIRGKSTPLFLVLSGILLFYLTLIQSPQAATRAIISFLLGGVLYKLGLKISLVVLLGLSIAACFTLYPEWISYPIGLTYSSIAVLSLYLSLPIVFDFTKLFRLKVLKIAVSSVLTSLLVSIFIAPLSFYFFHYYNFISIITNIPIGILFFIFIYVASFASLINFIYAPLAIYSLNISDWAIKGMLTLLSYTEQWSLLKFYTPVKIPIISLLFFYLGLIITLQAIKRYYQISEMKL